MRLILVFFILTNLSLFGQDQFVNSGSVYMHPNSNIATFGHVKNDGTFTGSGGTLIFSGTTSQNISGSTALDIYNLTISNASATGVVLVSTNVQVTNVLLFTDGNVVTSVASIMMLKDNASSSGASVNGYVEGPMQKTGNDSFSFPVGKAGNYQPISITAPAITTDIFRAEYFYTDPVSAFGSTLEPGIDHISQCEYWILDRTNGSSNVDVTLNWNTNSCGVTDPLELVVTHWDTTQWVNFGNGGITGNASTGTIVSTSFPTGFGVFTLGSLTSNNPLPIELLFFNAEKKGERVEVIWETASEKDNDYFTIERSGDGINFETISVINAIGNSSTVNSYSIVDSSPFKLTSYYRLKQTDMNGAVKYSEIRSVYFESSASLLVYPNPCTGNSLSLIRTEKWKDAEIVVYDMSGKMVYSSNFTQENAGENRYIMNFEETLPVGIYTVQVSDSYETLQAKFIVN